MNNEPPFNDDQNNALRRLRVRWLVTLLAVMPLPFIALVITGSDWLEQTPGGSAKNGMLLGALLGGGVVFAGLYARNQSYKAHWRGEVVEPAGYVKGNSLFFAAVNVAAGLLFVISLFTGYPAPTFAAAPILVALLAMNFPNGRPMQATPPRLGEDGGLS